MRSHGRANCDGESEKLQGTLRLGSLYGYHAELLRPVERGGAMRSWQISTVLALAVITAAVLFVAYAFTGADLCVWCFAQGQ